MTWQLAQVNAARPRHPLDDPRMAEFAEAIARINLLAEAAPGFVWRHAAPGGHLDGADVGEAGVILNISIWDDYLSLHAFTYRGLHGRYLTARERWFDPIPGATTALWWIREGEKPTPEQAIARLRVLRREGPTSRAFSVLRRFPPPAG